MTPTLSTILSIGALPLLAGLTYATTMGGHALWAWLTAKAGTNLVAREALVLEDLALSVVQDIEANEKAALEAKGMPLTAADFKSLKDLAVSRLKAVLEAKGLGTLENMLGAITTSPVAFNQVLSGKVEQAVAKVSAATAAGTVASAMAASSPPK